jgi:hypothetical protein
VNDYNKDQKEKQTEPTEQHFISNPLILNEVLKEK